MEDSFVDAELYGVVTVFSFACGAEGWAVYRILAVACRCPKSAAIVSNFGKSRTGG